MKRPKLWLSLSPLLPVCPGLVSHYYEDNILTKRLYAIEVNSSKATKVKAEQ
jgi:hypothetical protein